MAFGQLSLQRLTLQRQGVGSAVEPAVVAMTAGLTTVGMSLPSGYEVPAGQKGMVARSEGYNGVTPSDLLLAGCVETQISGTFFNVAAGGTTPQQVATAFTGLSTTNKDRHILAGPFRNEVPNEATISDAAAYDLTHMATIWAARTHDRMLVMGVTGGEARLIERWARRQMANKALWRGYSGYVFDGHRMLVQAGGVGNADDITCQGLDIVPFTYRTGVDTATPPVGGDTVHWNEAGNQIIADEAIGPFVRAWEGYRPFITPYEEVWLTGSAATDGQTNGGAIMTVVRHGSVGTFSLPAQTHSAHFAIDAVTGAITRASATVLTAGYYDLTVRVSNNYGFREGVRRIFFGKTSTAPKTKTLDGTAAMILVPRAVAGLPAAAATGGFCARIRPTVNSVGRFLMGPANGRITIQLLSSNRWNIIFKNSSNTNVINITQRAGLTHPVNTWGWLWVNYDLSTGSPVCNFGLELDGSAADFATPSVTTLTGTTNVDWAQILNIFCGTVSVSTAGLPSPWIGDMEQMLALPSGCPDWTVSGNRDLVRDATTRAALDVGTAPTIGGHAATINLGELSAGDLAYGNAGNVYGLNAATYLPSLGITG